MTRSPRTIAARRARENAAAFAEREAKLLTVAEKFFALEASSPAAKIEADIEALERSWALHTKAIRKEVSNPTFIKANAAAPLNVLASTSATSLKSSPATIHSSCY